MEELAFIVPGMNVVVRFYIILFHYDTFRWTREWGVESWTNHKSDRRNSARLAICAYETATLEV
jgi:hypothetical protein